MGEKLGLGSRWYSPPPTPSCTDIPAQGLSQVAWPVSGAERQVAQGWWGVVGLRSLALPPPRLGHPGQELPQFRVHKISGMIASPGGL